MLLLEREDPLDVLGGLARRAVAGRGGVVLVAGEAGIGKTVLLRTFGERLGTRAPQLWGMCDSLSTPRPLGPLRDVTDDLGPGIADLLGGRCPARALLGGARDAPVRPAGAENRGPALG